MLSGALRAAIQPVILSSGASGRCFVRTWRIVFSSSAEPIRASGAAVVGLPGSLAFWARGIAESLFATLFPSDCRLCNSPLLSITRLPVCQSCLTGIRPIADGVCRVCGERLWSPYALEDISGDALCGLCRKALPPFAKAAAYGSYDGALRGLLHLLKYEQVRPAARVLGSMLANAIADLEIQPPRGGIVVVPVPLHPRKLRQRGFNQSEVIARAALERVGTQMSLNPKVLKRLRETRSQNGLTRHQRRENMRGAFAVLQPRAIEGREICWSMTCSLPAPRFLNARACCAGPVHQRYGWLRQRGR